jgi:methylmalonyl-CoA mutase
MPDGVVDDALAGAFAPVDPADWLAKAAPEAEAMPATPLDDGIDARWLYTPADALAPDPGGVPGEAPFVRGTRIDGVWDIRQEHVLVDARRSNPELLADLEGGVTSLVLRIDDADPAAAPADVDELEALLDGVLLDLAPIALRAGGGTRAAAALLIALWQRKGVDPRGALGADPLGTLAARGELPTGAAEAVADAGALAAEVAATWPGVRALAVDTGIYADAGATGAYELALSIATGAAYLRAAEAAGLAPADGAAQLEFTLSVGPDQFLEIAKLRAHRRLWARVLEVAGVEADRRRSVLVGRTAWWALSAVDPWVNMLRGTTAAFAAAAGGADAVTVLPFDAALGTDGELGRRIARNTQLILQDESALSRVADPGGGSWYVEALTDQLAQAAWTHVQEIERAGGVLAVLLDGSLAERLTEHAVERDAGVASRARLLTGVNAFPLLDERLPTGPTEAPEPRTATASGVEVSELATDPSLAAAVRLAAAGAKRHELAAAIASAGGRGPLGEPASPGEPTRIAPLDARRLAEPFERLRARADAEVLLVPVGPIAKHVNALNWARAFYEAGGVRPVESGTPREAVVCAAPDEDAEAIRAAVAQARAQGAATVALVGDEAAAQEAGADLALHDGVDMVALLTDVLDRAEAAQ